jgi:hypothetical protein
MNVPVREFSTTSKQMKFTWAHGPLWALWAHGPLWALGPLWAPMGPYGPSGPMGPYGPLCLCLLFWAHGPLWALWARLGPWARMGPLSPIGPMGPSSLSWSSSSSSKAQGMTIYFPARYCPIIKHRKSLYCTQSVMAPTCKKQKHVKLTVRKGNNVTLLEAKRHTGDIQVEARSKRHTGDIQVEARV